MMWFRPPSVPEQQPDVAALYRQYRGTLHRRAMRILYNAELAEDVVQEVFLVYIKYSQRTEVLSPGALLYRMATQVALRRLMLTRRSVLMEDPGEHSDPDRRVQEDRLALAKILSLVSPLEAQIAVHHYIDGMSQYEIAELLEMSRPGVGRALERFCSRARKLLGNRDAKDVVYSLALDGPTDDGSPQ